MTFFAIVFWMFSIRLLRIELILLFVVELIFYWFFVVNCIDINWIIIVFMLRIVLFFFYFVFFDLIEIQFFQIWLLKKIFFWFNVFVNIFTCILKTSFKQTIIRKFSFNLWNNFDYFALSSKFKFIFKLFKYKTYFFTLWLNNYFVLIYFFLISSRR